MHNSIPIGTEKRRIACMDRRPFRIAVLFLLVAARLAHGQAASLGKGWLLDSAGRITSVPAEVVSGGNSIKGSSSDPNPSQARWFLETDPGYVRFAPNQTYTITLTYRIITAAPGGFQLGFESPTGNGVGSFGPSTVIRGPDGSSGTATFTSTLGNFPDYHASFSMGGPGAIVLDDIRITNSIGQLVASENAEGPALGPGLLDFQVTGGFALLTEKDASVNSAAVKD